MKRKSLDTDIITKDDGNKELQLIKAIKDGSLESVKDLIAQGAKVNDSIRITGHPLAFTFSLAFANNGYAYGVKKYLAIAEALMSAGANLENIKPHILLHDAIENNCENICIFLLDQGVSPDAKRKGLTPLHLTCKLSIIDIAKINIHTEDASTKIDIAKLLLKKGANVNALGDGMTPLHYLCHIAGIDQKKTKEAFSKATEEQTKKRINKDIVKLAKKQVKLANLLIKKQADIEALYDGMTPLQHAIKNNLVNIVKVLIQSGAKFLTQYKGKTAIENADNNSELQNELINTIKACRPNEWSDNLAPQQKPTGFVVINGDHKEAIAQALRLLGHIFNDSNLGGSSLQGSYLYDNAIYMHDFVSKFVNNEISFHGISPEKEMKIKANCLGLKELLEAVMEITNLTSENEVDTIIRQFEQKGRAFGPGGYFRHAMMYELRVNKITNHCELLIWNTGGGLNNHLYEETFDNILYYPVKAYRMPAYDQLDKTAFKDYLSLLLAFRNKKEGSDANILYNEIIPKIVWLDGKEFEPIEFQNHKYEGQWSGTCGWQVIMMMVKHYGFNELSSDEFQYELMIYSLEKFLKILTDEDYQKQDVALHLQYAIKNFAIFLKKIDDIAKREKALILINFINEKFKIKRILPAKELKLEIHPNCSLTLSRIIPSIEVKAFENKNTDEEKNIKEENEYKPFVNYKPLDQVNLISAKEFKTIIQSIVTESIEDSNARVNLLRRIEHIIFNLPNNEEYWKMSSEEINEFIHLLTLLAEKYYTLCQKLKYHYAENTIALKICYGLGMLLAKINNPLIELYAESTLGVEVKNEHFTISQERIVKSIHQFHRFDSDLLNNFLKSISKHTLLVEEVNNNKQTLKGLLNHYHISDNSANVSEILPAIYYCLMRQSGYVVGSTEKIEQKYPEVERNFQIVFSVLALEQLYHCGRKGFESTFKKNQDNKWIFLKIQGVKSDSNSNPELKINFKFIDFEGDFIAIRSHHIEDNQISKILHSPIFADKQIEIRIHSTPLSEKTDILRRLAHIQSRPESKIVATIEFIKSSLVELNAKDLQTCLFLFLFHENNLLREIQINPQVMDHLFQCIEKGIEFYRGQKSPSTLLFFYKVNTFLNHFLIHANIENTQGAYLPWIKRSFYINQEIVKLFYQCSNKKNSSSSDKAIIAMLNCLLLIHLYNTHTFYEKLTNEEWNLFFICNCLLSQLLVRELDPFIRKEVAKATDTLRCAALTGTFDLTLILNNICEFFKVELDAKVMKPELFPYFNDNYYSIDLLNGVITQKSLKEIILPSSFNTMFVSSTQSKALQINSNSFELTINNYTYRVNINSTGNIIQKHCFGKCFQLLDCGQLEDFAQYKDNILPFTLVDETKRVWQADDGSYIITESDTSHKIQYLYDSDKGIFSKLNEEEIPQWELDRTRELEVIKRFEDPNYTEIWHDIKTSQVVINLPRYGLQFYSVLPHTTPLQFICKGFEDYHLAVDKTIPIINFEHALILDPNDSQANLDTLYLVPKQVFMPSNEVEDDASYKLIFDLQNKVNYTSYANRFNFTLDLQELNRLNNTGDRAITDPEINHYQNQEKFAIYQQGKQGELTTQKVADQFYLAYLYFAKRDVEKCYQVLKSVIHAVSGNEEELSYLRYIITDTPSDITDKKQAKECTSTGPEYLSIRLFALYILVEFLKSGESVTFSSINSIKGSINIQAANYKQEKLKLFLDVEFQDILKDTLYKYLTRENYIPKAMWLSSAQLLSLLTSLNKCNQEMIIFKAVKKELMLKRTAKEYQGLCKLTQSEENMTTLTPLIQEKIQKLDKDYYFTPYSKELIEETTSISLGELDKDRLANPFEKEIYGTLDIDDLSLKTDDKKFRQNVLFLYRQIQTNEKKEEKLLTFLSKKLQYFLANKEWFMGNHQATIGATLLLMSMLKNKVKANGILKDLSDSLESKILSLLMRKFSNEKYSASTRTHKLVGCQVFLASSQVNLLCSNYNNLYLYKEKDTDEIYYWATVNGLPAKQYLENDVVQIILNRNPVFHSIYPVKCKDEELSRYILNITSKKGHTSLPNNKNAFTIENKSALNDKPFAKNIMLLKEKQPILKDKVPALGMISFEEELAKEMNADLKAGIEINNEAEKQNEYFLQSFGGQQTRNDILIEVESRITTSQGILDKLKVEIELAINSGNSIIDRGSWEIFKVSQSIKLLTLDDALDYFGKYSMKEIQEKRFLSEETTLALMENIQKYLIEATEQQRLVRIKDKLVEIKECEDDEDSKRYLIIQLGNIISQKRCYSSETDPDILKKILLFEYRENKLIYEIQYKIILKLLEKDEYGNYVSKAIQHIMGGGKSTVILPLWLGLLADGTNLCIAEVPAEIFELFFHDLSATSRIACSQKAFPFKFHRNIPCNTDYFYYLRNKFKSIIANKDYILTIKKSIDSLVLKYIDMLTFPETSSEKYNDYLKAIEYFDEIINMLPNQGNSIIEEIDSILAPQDQLIYTMSEGVPIEKHLLRAIVNLYDFSNARLLSIITGETSRPPAETLEALFGSLINDLVHSPYSPIFFIIKEMTQEEKQIILYYLQNKKSDNDENILQSLPSQQKDILALYKEELNRLLTISIKKDCDEHYGFSKDKDKDPMQLEIAIPYHGNNTPNELAHFQCPLLTINYTIQAQKRRSLSYYIFEKFIKDLKEQYEIEKIANLYYGILGNLSPELENIVNKYNLQLDELNLDDKEQLKQLHHRLKDEDSLKKYCLTEFILPSILKNNETLSSDSQNHIICKSSSGFTGTDYNHRTYHPSIKRDNAESFGTDGQTINNILKSKNQRTHVLKQEKYSEIFTLIDEHPEREKIRAIIDRGAIFKGVRNREVANQLSRLYFQDKYKACDIKYILYFNRKGKLCAIKTSDTPEKEKRKMLGGTKNIDKKLKCRPDQRVTSYSQNETMGADINQAINTIGLVTLSEHNTLRDFLQAAARLRDLKGSHSVEPVIMKGLASANPQIEPNAKGWNISTILNVVFKTQTKSLMNAHLTSTLQKIRDVFRNDLIRRLLRERNIHTKIELAKDFRNYLFDCDRLSFFERYGAPERMITTEEFLRHYLNSMVNRWLDCFKNNEDKTETLKSKLKLEEQCQEIIEKAIPVCEKWQKSNVDFGAENQVIAQNETHHQRQQQNEKYNECEGETDNKTSVQYLSWVKVDWKEWAPDENAIVPCFKLDNESFDLTNKKNWNFSDTIYLSYNFLKTCVEVPGALNSFSKPCCYTLVILLENTLKHVLITEQEAVEIRKELPPSKENIWVETISGIPYAGKRPLGIEANLVYQSNMEQLQYFSGDLVYLRKESNVFKQHREEKMDFLENRILRSHPSKLHFLSIFKKLVTLDPVRSENTIINPLKRNNL